MRLKPLFFTAMEQALQQNLARNPSAREALTPLHGRVVALRVEPFGWKFFVSFTTQRIQLHDHYERPADATLSGDWRALAAMAWSGHPMHALFRGEVNLHGDVTVGEHVRELLQALALPIDRLLAPVLGPTAAMRLTEWARQHEQWWSESLETLRLNLSEFLQEETRVLPHTTEAEVFYADVDELRLAYDRLNARVQRMQNLVTNRSIPIVASHGCEQPRSQD